MSMVLRVLATVLVLGAAAALWASGTLMQTPEAIITWSTESEVNTAGFHVYRAAQPDGPYERVTTELIPSSPDAFTGGEYEFRDPAIEAGNTYYYQLEELETTGNFTRLPDVVEYAARSEPNWVVVVALVAVLMLVWLLPGPARRKDAVSTAA
jgi:hypothetical protein